MICPEAQGPSTALHDDVWTQSAENARFVVFSRVEVRNNDIVRIRQGSFARRTRTMLPMLLARELALVGAIDAEYMAVEDC